MAGLTPGSQVYPTVFGPPAEGHPQGAMGSVLADLPPVTVDTQGEATITFVPNRPLVPGAYSMWVENGPYDCQGADRACRFFTVGSQAPQKMRTR